MQVIKKVLKVIAVLGIVYYVVCNLLTVYICWLDEQQQRKLGNVKTDETRLHFLGGK